MNLKHPELHSEFKPQTEKMRSGLKRERKKKRKRICLCVCTRACTHTSGILIAKVRLASEFWSFD